MSKTITGREINATPNYSKKTFTIRVSGAKYRTLPMNKQEFTECLHMTVNDWQQFLKTDAYYPVN